MRVSDIFLAVPQIVLAIAISQTLGPSIENVILALSVTYWPWFTRLVHAEVRSLKNETFIEAAIALGVPTWRIVLLHVLPNVMSPIIVRTSIGMGFTILTASALGFLGLGAPPPAPEWGRMISESREFLPEAWWYALAPGLAIFLVVMGFNLLGDGLRDVLDPRIRRAGAPDDNLLDVENLRVSFATEAGVAKVLDGVNLTIRPRRDHGAGRRIRLRQDHARARHPRHPAGQCAARGRQRSASAARTCSPCRAGGSSDEVRGPAHHLHPARPVRLLQSAVPRSGRRPWR